MSNQTKAAAGAKFPEGTVKELLKKHMEGTGEMFDAATAKDIREGNWSNKKDPMPNLRNTDIKIAYEQFKEGNINDEVINLFCTATAFYEACKGEAWSAAIISWLMSPAPKEWFDSLSEDQINSLNGAWTVVQRNVFDYPISRLEYWSTIWVTADEQYETKNFGAYTTSKRSGEEGATDKDWTQELRTMNQNEWEAAFEIIKDAWGGYYDPSFSWKIEDDQDKENRITSKAPDKITNADIQFAEMIAINQAKGPLHTTSLGVTVGEGLGNFPWSRNRDNVATYQWFYQGKGQPEEGNTTDPVTYSILNKLLMTDQGYNNPFDVETMGWRERLAFGNKMNLVSTEDSTVTIETLQVEYSSAFQYTKELTANNFAKKVISFLKADDSEKFAIWNGVLKDDATAVEKVEFNLRSGDMFNDDSLSKIAPAPGGAPAWSTSLDDGNDWDTGMFFWQDQVAGEGVSYWDQPQNLSAKRDATRMGFPRLMHWLMPTADKQDHWLGSPRRDLLFQEYSDGMMSIALGKLSGRNEFGRVVSASLTGYGRYPIKWTALKASGFFNWDGWAKGDMGKDMWIQKGSKGNVEIKRDMPGGASAIGQRMLSRSFMNESKIFIPEVLEAKDRSGNVLKEWDTGALTGDLVADVNFLANEEKLKGEGWEAESTVDSPAAKEIIDKSKASWLKLTGLSEKGQMGPTADALNANAEWFQKNFSDDQLVPKDLDNSGFTTAYEPGVPEEMKAVLNKTLGAGWQVSQILCPKAATPWTARYGTRTEAEVPWDSMLRRYQAAAYWTALYYRLARKEVDDVKILITDIWEHYAFKCAYHFYRVWEKMLHDHQCGNYYALLCVILAEADMTDPAVAGLMDALLDEVQAGDDELMDDIAFEDAPAEVEEQEEADKDQRERFYKQCALMLNMHRLVDNYSTDGVMHEKSKEAGYTAYNARIHMVTNEGGAVGQKNTILNKLITPPPSQMKSFINIPPAEASSLLPYVRFFRVWNEPDGEGGAAGKLRELEFDFPKYPQRDVSSDNPFDRGDGVGLEEFTWECDGETPATASKYINATLTLNFQTFGDFTRKRKNKSGHVFRWVDMFVSPTSMVAKGGPLSDTPHTLRYDAEYYRIRVDVGYHTNQPAPLDKAIATQNKSFFLVLKDNEININDDMSVTIKANYGAYIEEAMDSNKFNALSTPTLKSQERGFRLDWAEATRAWKSGNCSDQELRLVRNMINAKMEALMKAQHKSIMTNMLNLERIFYIDMEADSIDRYRLNGTFDEIPTYKDATSVSPGTSAAERLKNRFLAAKEGNMPTWEEAEEPHKDYRVYYFYFGDLIYLINSMMYQGEFPWVSKGLYTDTYVKGAENSKILLMDFDYHNPLTQEASSRMSLNIAMIPISVDFFFQWYVNNIIKNETYQIGVGNFIKRLLTELITEAMAEVCMSSEEGHYTTFQHGSISVGGVGIDDPNAKDAQGKPERRFVDPITSMMLSAKAATDPKKQAFDNSKFDVEEHYNKVGMEQLSLPLRSIPEERVLKEFDKNGVEGQFQYLYIYGDTKDPYHEGVGDEELDSGRGTFHLQLAQNAGLVKNISFSKNNIPYLRESRMFNQGQAGLLQLSAVYDCEIEMIGNTLFLPGQEVWVNPYGFGGKEFGKPQDPPLNWSPTVAEINSVNDKIEAMEADSNITKEELADTSAAMDDVTAATTSRTDSLNLEVLSYANVMGIGGYQLIIRTKCSIKPGDFTTTISAKHVYSGYPMVKQSLHLAEFRDGKPGPISAADSGEPNACRAIRGAKENEPT